MLDKDERSGNFIGAMKSVGFPLWQTSAFALISLRRASDAISGSRWSARVSMDLDTAKLASSRYRDLNMLSYDANQGSLDELRAELCLNLTLPL